MVNDILTPMNHREIEYNAKRLSGVNIPDSFICGIGSGSRPQDDAQLMQKCTEGRKELLAWLEQTGKRVFDAELVMDYGTDCLRLYLLFESTPKEQDAPYYESWQEGALEGLYKFLGRYRRLILAVDEWNKRGNYHAGMLSAQSIARMKDALEQADTKINKCISRGNTMPNRHNIVSALMELLNIFQKELKIGEIVTALHSHAIETGVPHNGTVQQSPETMQSVNRNPQVTELSQNLIILTAPYAPDLSKVLWEFCIRSNYYQYV